MKINLCVHAVEDAVAPDAKAVARETVAREIKAGGYGHREVIIRSVRQNSIVQERCTQQTDVVCAESMAFKQHGDPKIWQL